MTKKLSIFLLALFASAGITQAAIVDGSCGDNLTWSLNTKDSTLTITGSGEMTNWGSGSSPWYDYRSYIKYVSLPDGLTSIGKYAFEDCSGLTSVTIPNSVTSIGQGAFQKCSSMTSVTIPNSVTSIGRYAFRYCRGLTSVTIPNSVTSIGDKAFYNCSGLTSLTIGNSVTSIGESAFSGCSGLTSVTIPNSVTSIGGSAFSGCSGLTSVTIPNSVTSIGSSAFSGCSGLTSVTIPNSVTSIGEGAFDGCSITTLTVLASAPPSGGSACGINAGNCTLYVPAESVNTYANTIWWEDFKEIKAIGDSEPEESEDPRSQYDSEEDIDITFDKYKIDNYVEQYGLLFVSAEQTINENDYLINLQLYVPEGTIKLVPGTYPIVKEENIPGSIIEGTTDGMKLYGSFLAKQNSTGGIEVPLWFLVEGNVTVDDNLKISVDAVNTKGAKIQSVLRGSFGGNCGDNLTWSLNTKDSTLTITGSGEMTSSPWSDYKSYIKYVSLPDGVTSIGKSAFSGCSSLTSVTIPNSVTSIGYYAFEGCSGLTDIYVSCGDLARIQQMLNYDNRVKYVPLSYNITTYAVNGYVSTPQNICEPLELVALPDYGYHFVHWSDGITDNPRSFELAQDTTFTAVFIKNPIITYVYDSNMGYINGNTTLEYDSVGDVTFTAIPYDGYHFVQWSDGITDNPRTITLTQDTTFTAEFAVDMSGKCGDNLVWALEDGILTITGSGDMWNEKPWSRSTQQIKQVIFPKGLTSIGGYTFTDCTGLTSLSIPANVTMVGGGAFYGCSNITSFEGPVVALESMVSSKIASVVINSGELNNFSRLGLLSEVLERLDLSGADCSVLPKRALYDFYMLRELVLPINLETIGYMAVANCKNLQRITIPASVTDIAQSAFEDCRSLSDLTFAEGSKLETIGSWAFYNCHNLPKIEIPEGVTEIGDAAFYGCVYAESLKLPASIHSLGDNAFALCSKLNRMDVDAVEPPTIVAKTFNEVSRKAPVYVPDESVSLYKADPLWGEMNIVGQHEAPSGINPVTGNPSPVTHKVLRNGQILILRGEKVYTLTGQQVK